MPSCRLSPCRLAVSALAISAIAVSRRLSPSLPSLHSAPSFSIVSSTLPHSALRSAAGRFPSPFLCRLCHSHAQPPIPMVERKKQTARKSTGGFTGRVSLVIPESDRVLRSASKSPSVGATTPPPPVPTQPPPAPAPPPVIASERYRDSDHVSYILYFSSWLMLTLKLLVVCFMFRRP